MPSPAPNFSTIVSAGVRVPAITGLPIITAGSEVIRGWFIPRPLGAQTARGCRDRATSVPELLPLCARVGAMSQLDFASAFGQLTGNPPFPWQSALHARL